MLTTSNNCVDLYSNQIHEHFKFNETEILEANISYPQINLPSSLIIQNFVNNYYLKIANDFYKYASTELKSYARETFQYRIENKYPFMSYEAVMNYVVALRENCLLSTYIDQYQYAGGAHGSTVRSSNSWNLQTGHIIELKDLFPQDTAYIPLIIEQITEIANQQIKNNEFIYFEDYKELIPKYYNPKSFYLTPTDLIVYYQQYEIGPYASGIIEFRIPYNQLGISIIDLLKHVELTE